MILYKKGLDDSQNSAFARTARPKQGYQLPLFDIKIDAVNGRKFSKSLGQINNADSHP